MARAATRRPVDPAFGDDALGRLIDLALEGRKVSTTAFSLQEFADRGGLGRTWATKKLAEFVRQGKVREVRIKRNGRTMKGYEPT